MIKVPGGGEDSFQQEPDFQNEPIGVGAPQQAEPTMPDAGMETPSEGGNGKADSEIDNIFGKLDTEKQSAVIKYAKSLVNDDNDDTPVEEDVVNEIANNIMNDKSKPSEREDKKIRNKRVSHSNPFVTKNFHHSSNR